MRRIADLHPGEGKTDARDAFVIADAARTLPHALRRVGPDEQTVIALGVLAGYDADLAAEATRLTNRLHDALLHVHPALERLLGKQFRPRGVLELLAAAGTPAQLAALGEDGLRQALMTRSPRMALTLPAQILAALDEQTIIVPATEPSGWRGPGDTAVSASGAHHPVGDQSGRDQPLAAACVSAGPQYPTMPCCARNARLRLPPRS